MPSVNWEERKKGKNEPCSPQKAFVEYGTRRCLSSSDRGVGDDKIPYFSDDKAHIKSLYLVKNRQCNIYTNRCMNSIKIRKVEKSLYSSPCSGELWFTL